MEIYRRSFAEINLDNLVHNFQLIRKELPETEFLCPMIKANAYGHGEVESGLALEEAGATTLGVCLLEEAISCRKGGVRAELLMFRGFDSAAAQVMLEHNVTPVVSCFEQLEVLESAAVNSISLHLKFDTGMNRLGFACDQAEKILSRIKKSKKLRVAGVLTHLFNGQDAFMSDGQSVKQLHRFQHVVDVFDEYKPKVHALNSAGVLSKIKLRKQNALAGSLLSKNWGLRPGLMLYGYNPIEKDLNINLKPVMTLKSEISQTRFLKKGETVSYSGTWTAKRDSIIGVLPIGYGDGYHRVLSNQTEVLCEGQVLPGVGTITMDYMMVDLTDFLHGREQNLALGKEVILFGQSAYGQFLSAEKLAQKAQTISYEILTSVGARVPRVFRKGGE